jgi:uncharacterized protein (TIGR00296 family)
LAFESLQTPTSRQLSVPFKLQQHLCGFVLLLISASTRLHYNVMATHTHALYCFEVLAASFETRKPLGLHEVSDLYKQYQAEDRQDQGEPDVSHVLQEARPMFITWNTIRKSGHKRLRGCIGTFAAQELEYGLKTYALTSAFDDNRFSPMAVSELSTLECDVTFLTDFEDAPEPMAWDLGTHGLRITFSHRSRRMSSTYLPHVATEQGWDKTETMVSLMRKAGWNGRDEEWQNVQDLHVVRYQGRAVSVDYEEYAAFQSWLMGKRRL